LLEHFRSPTVLAVAAGAALFAAGTAYLMRRL
jgi:hypothetical protein